MRLFNTLTRTEEDFVPADGKTVRMYTCGLTVYARGHIGNFRTFVSLDVLRRALRHQEGYAMRHVMNFTDVDDKTITASQQAGVSLREYTDRYIDAFREDSAVLGLEPVPFLGRPNTFPWVIVFSDVWKEFGFEAIIYLAALAGIDPTLYEVAELDGANRFQKMFYVSLPGILPTIVLVASLSISNVLNAGFDQIFNLYSPIVYSTGDVLDTYVYRVGLIQGQYSIGTTVGLLKTVISLALIGVSYWAASKFANYRIF